MGKGGSRKGIYRSDDSGLFSVVSYRSSEKRLYIFNVELSKWYKKKESEEYI